MYATMIEPIGTLRAVGLPKCYRCGQPYTLVGTHVHDKERICVRCQRIIEGRTSHEQDNNGKAMVRNPCGKC